MEENENLITATSKFSNKKIKNIIKNNAKLLKQKGYLVAKLGYKTKALWIASEIIQEKLMQDKTVDNVYEMLKLLGKTKYLETHPDKEKFLK